MSRRRWIADVASGNRAALVGEHAAHLARVLRAQPGQEFEIVAAGAVRLGRILSVNDQQVEFELREEIAAPALANVTLALAVFKFDRMEWAIEKATELGTARILPLLARRTDAHLAAAAAKRVERWRRIAREASEQARRVAPPEIAAPIKLQELLQAPFEARIVLSEAETQDRMADVARRHGSASATALAIGPEGGWTEDELRLFGDAGWISATLGPTILRAETAAIAALAVVMAESF